MFSFIPAGSPGDSLDYQQRDWTGGAPLDADGLQDLLREAIGRLDVRKARQEVDRFVKDKSSLDLWSHEFFLHVARQVKPVGTPPAVGR